MQFKDVIGHTYIKDKLVSLYQQNRVSHALLLLGRDGSGSLSLARAFAQYLVCEKVNGNSSSDTPDLFGSTTTETYDPTDSCGKCPACIKAAGLVHPDIHYTYPTIKHDKDTVLSSDFAAQWRVFQHSYPYGNIFDWLQHIQAENKQGKITAAECDDIGRRLNLKSFESKVKVLILWMPEYLGKEGNKLLKLIEEPPANTIFLLVAENESSIIPTIVSRTQLVKVPPIADDDLMNALVLKHELNEKLAKKVVSWSDGNYHRALEMVQHGEDDSEPMLREWMNTILKTGPSAQVKWIDEIGKLGREQQKHFLQYFLQQVELSVRLQSATNNADETNDFAARLGRLCSIHQLEEISQELTQSIYQIERNAHSRILFHALTIRLYHIIGNNSVILLT